MMLSMRFHCQKGSKSSRGTPAHLHHPNTTLAAPMGTSGGFGGNDLQHLAIWASLLWTGAHSPEAQFCMSHTQMKQSRSSNRPHLGPPHFSVGSSDTHGCCLTLSTCVSWVQRRCNLDRFRRCVALSELFNLSGPQSSHLKIVL